MLKTGSSVSPPFCETLYFYRSIYLFFYGNSLKNHYTAFTFAPL